MCLRLVSFYLTKTEVDKHFHLIEQWNSRFLFFQIDIAEDSLF